MNIAGRLTLMIRLARHARRTKLHPRTCEIIGLIGKAETSISPGGTIFVRGELWPARSTRAIARGAAVRVVGIGGTTLDVDPDQTLQDPASLR